jgi:hypothetical protein
MNSGARFPAQLCITAAFARVLARALAPALALALVLLPGLTAQAQTAASRSQSLTTLEPVGEQRTGLWLTDYRPGAPLFFDEAAVRFRPWAKGLFDARQEHDLEPHARCKASGAVRQFIYIFDIGGPHTYREVFMDGRSHPADLIPTNYGHNIGWWDGDVLVIDSVGYNEDFWFERMGLPHTEAAHLVEYFWRPEPGLVEYRFLIDDPDTYEAPVEGRLNLLWREGEELFEYICQQSNYAHELMVNPEDLLAIGRTSRIVP